MSLRDFIALLRREDELAVVAAPVDPYLEMAEIADRASKAGGPALLFERPVAAGALAATAHHFTGPSLPVLMNQFGSPRRLAPARVASPPARRRRCRTDPLRAAPRVAPAAPSRAGRPDRDRGRPVSLRDFVDLLRREDELAVVAAPVDPYLEMAEIADRASKAGGPALLFERPVSNAVAAGAPAANAHRLTGPALPVLMNQFGSYRRLELALGAPLDALAARIGELVELQVPKGLVGKVKALGQLRELASFAPKVVAKAAFREVVVDPPDLGRLPVLTTWPGDGGPFITLPVCVTKDREGRRNAGMYRLQVYDARTTGMHWHVHHDGAANFREADGRLEVAVALGTDPAVTYAATAPLPAGIDELMFAGFLRGRPVELAACATVALEVPADAEIVLEGYVDKAETRREGPFGDHTGYYSLADDYPVFHLTAMSMRRDAVYPATIVGRPPMEDCFLGKATERLFLPLLRLTLPEIVDLELPIEGVFHDCAMVSIRKAYPGPRPQGDERRLGHGADDVHQVRRGRRRARRRARPARGGLAGVQQRRPAARHDDRRRPARRARPLEPDGRLRRQDGHRRDQVVARRRSPAGVAR